MAPSPLQIKVNALNRLIKEEKLYRKEADEQQERIDKHKAANGDEYELKKMNEVLEDTQRMVPELQKKIKSTLESLKEFLKGDVEEDTSVADEAIDTAEKYLQSA